MNSEQPGQRPPGYQEYAGDQQNQYRLDREIRIQEGGIFAPIFADIEYRQRTAQYSTDQAKQLQQGMAYRGDPGLPATDYQSVEHAELYGWATQETDPAAINEAGSKWNELGNRLMELQQTISQAAGATETTWQGASGEGARSFANGLSGWVGSIGQAAQLTGNRMHEQSEAAASLKTAIPEPVNFSFDDAARMMTETKNPLEWPNTISQIEQKFNESNAAHAEAAQVTQQYHDSLNTAGTTMPAFAPPPPPPMTGEQAPVASAPSETAVQQGRSGGAGGSVASGAVGGVGVVSGGGPGGTVSTTNTTAQGFQSPSQNQPTPVARPGVSPPPGAQARGPQPVAVFAPTGGLVGPGAPGAGGRPGFGSAGRGMAGGGRPGFGPTGSPGAGNAPGGGRGFGPTGGPAGPGVPGAGGQGAAGGRGPAGGMGAGGMGAGGRGRGGDDDQVHDTAKYLTAGDDPENLFGSDQRTPPPVIE